MSDTITSARSAPLHTLALLDDASLLASRSVDNEDAFREFYRRYHRPLYTFLLRRLPDRAAAEEALQESFLRLWRAADQYDEQRGSVAGLLFTIARNVATDALRRHARRPLTRGVMDDVTASLAAPVSDQTEVGLTVAAALDRLPAPHREILSLAYWGDLTQAQIADELRIPLGTVKSRVFLALKGLRAELVTVGVVA